MSTPGERLLSSTEEFPDPLDGQLANDIIAAARSTDDAEVNALLKAALLRGKAEVRIALDAISVQAAVQQQRRMVRITWLLFVATLMSAVAATATAIAALAG